MLIVLAGLPKCGKTTFLRAFVAAASHLGQGIQVYSPDLVLPENLEKMSEEDQKTYRISAWRLCYDETSSFCRKQNGKKVILDTTGANLSAIAALRDLCLAHHRDFKYVLVYDTKARCQARGVEMALLEQYFEKLRECLSKFRRDVIVVRNTTTVADLQRQAIELATRFVDGATV